MKWICPDCERHNEDEYSDNSDYIYRCRCGFGQNYCIVAPYVQAIIEADKLSQTVTQHIIGLVVQIDGLPGHYLITTEGYKRIIAK